MTKGVSFQNVLPKVTVNNESLLNLFLVATFLLTCRNGIQRPKNTMFFNG